MVTFVEEKKKQKRLIWILFLTLIAIAAVLWYGLWRETVPLPEESGSPAGQPPLEEFVEIGLSILDDPALGDLELFEGIRPLEGGFGRGNPFAAP